MEAQKHVLTKSCRSAEKRDVIWTQKKTNKKQRNTKSSNKTIKNKMIGGDRKRGFFILFKILCFILCVYNCCWREEYGHLWDDEHGVGQKKLDGKFSIHVLANSKTVNTRTFVTFLYRLRHKRATENVCDDQHDGPPAPAQWNGVCYSRLAATLHGLFSFVDIWDVFGPCIYDDCMFPVSIESIESLLIIGCLGYLPQRMHYQAYLVFGSIVALLCIAAGTYIYRVDHSPYLSVLISHQAMLSIFLTFWGLPLVTRVVFDYRHKLISNLLLLTNVLQGMLIFGCIGAQFASLREKTDLKNVAHALAFNSVYKICSSVLVATAVPLLYAGIKAKTAAAFFPIFFLLITFMLGLSGSLWRYANDVTLLRLYLMLEPLDLKAKIKARHPMLSRPEEGAASAPTEGDQAV